MLRKWGFPLESTTELDPGRRGRFPTFARVPRRRFGGARPRAIIGRMKRNVVLASAGAVLLAGTVSAWNAVRQEREYRRLVADGDTALMRDQTYDAIEDFSGALALKNDSMLAYLKR